MSKQNLNSKDLPLHCRTRLDEVPTTAGFLDVKMRSEILEDPRGTIAALGGPGVLRCKVRERPEDYYHQHY